MQAFVCRRPDEEHEAVYRFLLQRNARLYGVHYTLDRIGDIHLVGRVPLGAVSTDEIDRVLGQVLEAADGDFNTLLELGFATSIRREYAWRTERGESTANLKAFEHLFDVSAPAGPPVRAARGALGIAARWLCCNPIGAGPPCCNPSAAHLAAATGS